MVELSVSGRFYSHGKALKEGQRRKIIQDIIKKRGEFSTGFFVGSFSVKKFGRTYLKNDLKRSCL